MHFPKKILQATTLVLFVTMLVCFIAYRSEKFSDFPWSSAPQKGVDFEYLQANTVAVGFSTQDTTRKKKKAVMGQEKDSLKSKEYLYSSKSGAVVLPNSTEPDILPFPPVPSSKSDSSLMEQKRDSVARRQQAIMGSSKSGQVVRPKKSSQPKEQVKIRKRKESDHDE